MMIRINGGDGETRGRCNTFELFFIYRYIDRMTAVPACMMVSVNGGTKKICTANAGGVHTIARELDAVLKWLLHTKFDVGIMRMWAHAKSEMAALKMRAIIADYRRSGDENMRDVIVSALIEMRNSVENFTADVNRREQSP